MTHAPAPSAGSQKYNPINSGPLAYCYGIAVVANLACPYLDSPRSFIAAASLVAFVSDMCILSIWSFMQDVGRDHTAGAFGWGNIWGNLGAAVTPGLVPLVVEDWGGHGDWRNAFCLFAGGFLLAGLMALGIDPERKIGCPHRSVGCVARLRGVGLKGCF